MNLLLLSLALLGCLAVTVSTTERTVPTGLGCNGVGCHPKTGNGKRESAAEEAYAYANKCKCSAFGECYEWKDGIFRKVPFCPILKRGKSGAVEKRESAAEAAMPLRNMCYCSGHKKCYEVRNGAYVLVPFCTAKREASEEIVEKREAVEKRESAEKAAGGVDTNIQCPRCPKTSGKREATEEIVEKAVEKRESAAEAASSGNCSCTPGLGCFNCPNGVCTKVAYCLNSMKRDASEEIVEKRGIVERREASERLCYKPATCLCSHGTCFYDDGCDHLKVPKCPWTKFDHVINDGAVKKREVMEEKHSCQFLVCERPNAKSNRGCKRVPCDMEFDDVEKREAVKKSEAEETTIRKREAAFGFKSCMCNNGECEQCDDQGCETVASCTGKRAVSEEIVEKREAVEAEEGRP